VLNEKYFWEKEKSFLFVGRIRQPDPIRDVYLTRFGSSFVHRCQVGPDVCAAHLSVLVLSAPTHASRDSPQNPLLARALVAGNSAAATPVQSARRPPAAVVLTRLRTCLGTSCPPRASKPSPHFAAPAHTLPLPLHHHDARDKPLDDRPAQCIATARS
jgi:hypothetical protein